MFNYLDEEAVQKAEESLYPGWYLDKEAVQKAEDKWQRERERTIQMENMPFLIARIEKELSEILEFLKKAESKAES